MAKMTKEKIWRFEDRGRKTEARSPEGVNVPVSVGQTLSGKKKGKSNNQYSMMNEEYRITINESGRRIPILRENSKPVGGTKTEARSWKRRE
jgi:hypothetical protein